MEENKRIKSFVYLDEYKMYSISSQLFEGLTEYILANDKESLSENNTQKGKIGSGQVMGDILLKEKASTEKRYLHDYAFNLFEKELIRLNKVSESFDNIEDKPFVKMKGKILFNDYKVLLETLRNFNKIGEAIGYISNKDGLDQLNNLKENISKQNDRNSIAKFSQMTKKLEKEFHQDLINQGLMLDAEVLKRMDILIEYGYKNLFEINLYDDDNNIIYSSILNRKYLREEEDILISKYSRKTEVEFILLGILTQSGKEAFDPDFAFSYFSDTDEKTTLKRGAKNVINSLTGMENFFLGRLSNEYIIDPIAIYSEL